jgi:hypothetical protein
MAAPGALHVTTPRAKVLKALGKQVTNGRHRAN